MSCFSRASYSAKYQTSILHFHHWQPQHCFLSGGAVLSFGKKNILAIGSFDPPTLGLWAQCASSAPNRWRTCFNLEIREYKACVRSDVSTCVSTSTLQHRYPPVNHACLRLHDVPYCVQFRTVHHTSTVPCAAWSVRSTLYTVQSHNR